MPTRLRVLAAVVCAAVLGALAPAVTAHAESRTVQGGRLDWGVKTSFQRYVTGPIAHGSYSLTGGAATVGGSGFRFHSATGTYDGDTGAFRAAFSGGVRFVGHRTDSGAYRLDLTLSSPTVVIAGRHRNAPRGRHRQGEGHRGGHDVPSGAFRVPLPGRHRHARRRRLRRPGQRARHPHRPGRPVLRRLLHRRRPLDPVSLSADVRQPPRTTATSPAPKSPQPKNAEKTGKADKDAKGTGLVDGAVDWGVRRTFREYVTGDIARGRWTLTSGALDGGALFRFPGARGTFEDGDLTAAFRGAVRFTGAHGLDLRISAVRVTVTDGKGTLHADVTSPDRTSRGIPLVTFTAGNLKAGAGLVTVTEAPARLTAQGAEAFGGMYPAGTTMDPVTLAVALTGTAGLPALPDLGSTPTATPAASPSPSSATPEPVARATEPDDGTSPRFPSPSRPDPCWFSPAPRALLVRRRRAGKGAADTPQDH